jgi:hypothetical protein
MAPLHPPSEDEIQAFLADVRENNPGIGIVDLRTRHIYLACASVVPEGDHFSFADSKGLLRSSSDLRRLRGFVIGCIKGKWEAANLSGLNPRGNRMDAELFQAVLAVLMPLIGPAPKR